MKNNKMTQRTPTNKELNEIFDYLKSRYPNAVIDVYFDELDKTIYTKTLIESEEHE